MTQFPRITIPRVEVPRVNVPRVAVPGDPPFQYLNIEVPGCSYQHRDQNLNRNLLIEDPNGVFTNCPGGAGIPSFYPMDYEPKGITVIEEDPIPSSNPETPEVETPQPSIPSSEVECPGPTNLRIGDRRNAESLEKVVGHEVLNGVCQEIYEPTTVVDKYLPPASVVSTTAVTVVVATAAAAATPFLTRALKPLFKQLIKRIQKLLGKKPVKLTTADVRANRYRENRGLPPLKK